MDLKDIKKAHFISISGVAMSAVAITIKKLGINVTGSDNRFYDPVRSKLIEHGLLPNKEGYFTDNITNDIDVVIVGMHSSLDNPEYLKAKEMGLKIYSFPSFLKKFLKDKTVICISGTYGKTTTTALTTWILETAGLKPDYLIGGVCHNLKDSMRLTNSRFFVIEGDEYISSKFDPFPKFMYYDPDYLVVTSAVLEHINVFPTEKHYKKAFSDLFDSLKKNTKIIACSDNHELHDILPDKEISFYGLSKGITPRNIKQDKDLSFDVFEGNKKLFSITTPLFGEHNVKNILAAISIAIKLNINKEKIVEALATFKGTKRRLELVNSSPLVYDDLAHHPDKVEASLSSLRERFPNKKIWAVFEPYTFSSRTKSFIPSYKNSFDKANKVIIYKIDGSDFEEKEKLASNKDYIEVLKHKNPVAVDDKDELLKILKDIPKEDLILTMSPGCFDNALKNFLDKK